MNESFLPPKFGVIRPDPSLMPFKSSTLMLSVFVVSFLFSLIAYWPQLTNRYHINDDVRQHTFWTAQYKDSSLFPNNPYVAYNKYYSTPLFKGFYWLAVKFVEPLAAGKLLSLILVVLTAFLFFFIGRYLWDDVFGLLCVLAFLALPQVYFPFSGGLQRSFGIPLLAGLLLLCLKRKYEWSGFFLALALTLYPVSAALGFGVLLGMIMIDKWEPSKFKKILFLGGAAGFIGVLIAMVLERSLNHPQLIGPMLSRSEILADPAFSNLGRFLYEETHPPFFFTFIYSYLSSDWFAFAAVGAGTAGLIVLWRRISTPQRVSFLILPVLLIWSLLLYYGSYVMMPKMFIPVRYLSYAMYTFVPILIAFAFLYLIVNQTDFQNKKLMFRGTTVVLMAVGLLNASMLSRWDVVSTNYRYDALIELVSFIKKTPKDTLIAADPFESDNIMTFAQRNTYLSFELSHPWNVDYRKIFEDRTRRYYRMVFGTSLNSVRPLVLESGADYIVLTKRFYESRALGWERYFFNPVDQEIKKEFMNQDPALSALYQLPSNKRVFENYGYIVFSASQI